MGLERDETVLDALRREVAEEVGLVVTLPAQLTGTHQNLTWLVATELAYQACAIRVLAALDNASPPTVRAHDGVRLIENRTTLL